MSFPKPRHSHKNYRGTHIYKPVAMPIPVPPTQMSKPEGMQSSSISSISSSSSIDGAALKISGEVMVGAVIFLFMVLVFVILLYIYAKRYWGATIGLSGSSRSRLIFVPDTAPRRRGLDESVLHSLPVANFCSSDFKDGLECAVCLSDISDGEKFRLLPKCNHGFHLECIDMWFFSHSTCPLCRSAVGPEPTMLVPGNPAPAAETEAEAEAEVPTAEFPTNVLFWGTPNQVSAVAPPIEGSSSAPLRPGGVLVIDIPRRAVEGFSAPVSPLMSSRATGEEAKSPASDMKSPASARFKSLRRLLSYGKRSAVGPSSSWNSPREGGDLELGQGVLVTATTPRTSVPTRS